jgi:CheY-like chemotaxis protein
VAGGQIRDLPPDARVLVVDDNAATRHILADWLRGWRMQPTVVGDAPAALDALRAGVDSGHPFALVLLDARMPGADGLTIATKIRERPDVAAGHIILLVCSGAGPGDLARYRELGVIDHVFKPLQQDELREAIDHALGPARREAPATTRPAPSGDGARRPRVPLRSLEILVAEDNELNARHLEQLLVRRGHGVRLAGDGRQAIRLSREGAFDLVLLDVHMPEMDGFQVIRAIRERERSAATHLPVIALTARARREDRERCLAAGMDDFLTKPVSAAALWATIDRVLVAHPTAGGRPGPGLLDPRVLLAACGDDAAVLARICDAFRASLPDYLAAVRKAAVDRDAARLCEATHKLYGLVATFSTTAGEVATALEDFASSGQLEQAVPVVRQLETMCEELARVVDGLGMEDLRREAGDGDHFN